MTSSADHLLDLRPHTTFQNPFHGAAEIMAPQAPANNQDAQDALAYLRALGDRTPEMLTADPVVILMVGRIALNAEQREFMLAAINAVEKLHAEAG